MKLYLTGSTDPYYNLAAEEYYLRESEEDVFMLWQNEPTVVIGRNQNMYAEVDLAFTEERGIHVARRITGGGAVYHDLGNICYTFITSREKANVLDFAYFSAPVLKALDALGIYAKLSGRNDLLVESEPGVFAKFSGAAETATKTRVLHHGTLLYDSDLTVLSKALRPDPEKLRSKAIASVRSRVTNLRPLIEGMLSIDLDTLDFFEYLVSFAEREWDTRREMADREAILKSGFVERNASEDYNAGRRKAYEHSARKHFPSGLVVLCWNEEEGRFRDFRIEGDFFGELDVALLSERFEGAEIMEESVRHVLEGLRVCDYINGVTNEEFAALLEDRV
ncbi:MAG: lipoate--protein ligase [Lachnospiraceae bacterium]|nr:lipoate--protein ligase [Lachnospiraceae bacterium]